jgi:protease PrsW
VSEESVGIRLLMLSVALLPAIVMLLYFWDRDGFRTRAESVWSAVGIGALMAYPVIAVVALFVDPFLPTGEVLSRTLAEAFFAAALPEEGFKLLAIACIFVRNSDVKRPYDLVQLSIAVAVGFSAIENVFYIFGGQEWGATAALRSVTAVPAHAFFGTVMGVMVSRARFGGSRLYWPAAFVAPVLMHGLYNSIVFYDAEHGEGSIWATAAFVVVVIGMGIFAIHMSGTMRLESMIPNSRRRKLLWCVPATILILLGPASAVILLTAGEPLFGDNLQALEKLAYACAAICFFFGGLFFHHGWRRHL